MGIKEWIFRKRGNQGNSTVQTTSPELLKRQQVRPAGVGNETKLSPRFEKMMQAVNTAQGKRLEEKEYDEPPRVRLDKGKRSAVPEFLAPLNEPFNASNLNPLNVGIVLLYRSKDDAESDFNTIKSHLMRSSGDEGCSFVYFLDMNWKPNSNDPHKAFGHSIIWTAPDIKFGREFVPAAKWSRIVAGTTAYDIVLRSVGGQLTPRLRVDNITDCDLTTLYNLERKSAIILQKYVRAF